MRDPSEPVERKSKPPKLSPPKLPPPHLGIGTLENQNLEKIKTPLPRHRWIDQKLTLAKVIEMGSSIPNEIVHKLSIKNIARNDLIFQHRQTDKWNSKRHISNLLKALKTSGGLSFPPLTIFWSGEQWLLIDGHHRHEAYFEYQTSQKLSDLIVPVEVFKGTLDEAIAEALKGNSRDKLVMTSLEKSEGAWRLTLGTQLSFNQIVKASTRSRSTVTNMRRVMKEILKTHTREALLKLSWAEAQMVLKGLDPDREFNNDRLAELAQQMANNLLAKFGTNFGKNPEVVYEALCIYDSTLLPALMDMYREPEDEVQDEYVDDLSKPYVKNNDF